MILVLNFYHVVLFGRFLFYWVLGIFFLVNMFAILQSEIDIIWPVVECDACSRHTCRIFLSDSSE